MAGSSMRLVLQSSVGPKPTATHALVDFGDEGMAIVPFSRIIEGSTSKGMCRVKWNDGGEYNGELIVAGMYKDCVDEQKHLEREDSDMEEEERLMDVEKQTRKRKRKQIKSDDQDKDKKGEDKDKKRKNKNAGSAKDDFIIHISKLPPANEEVVHTDTTKEDENNLDDNTRVADGSKRVVTGGSRAAADCSRAAADCSTVVVDSGSSDSGTEEESSSDDEVPQRSFHTTIDLSENDGGNFSDKDDNDNSSDDIDRALKELKADIHQLNVEQNCQFEKVMLRFKAVEDQLKLLFTSGIAAALSSLSMSSLPLDEVVRRLQSGMNPPSAVTLAPPVPVTPAQVTPVPVTPAQPVPVTPTQVTPTQVTSASILATGSTDEELIHPSVLCPLIMRYKTRRSLAAAMVNEFFDTETRIHSNVRGRGKDQLDPRKIAYVKEKCFSLFPSVRDSDAKKDWDDCIVSIDDKGRELKRKLKKQDKS